MGNVRAETWFAVVLVVAVAFSSTSSVTGLSNGYYYKSCRNVESIIYKSVANSYRQDPTVAPGVVRLTFHDCFVRGCDASVLLAGSDKERGSILNAGLHGFNAIDAAKAAVEKVCPGVVSCADILQYAARDLVTLTGGQGWAVPAGRLDGTVSLAAEPIQNLPASEFNVAKLLPFFQNKGLNAAQMVALSGAHTIGISHCQFINNRLYTFSSSSPSDPTLPRDFLASLKRQCPSSTSGNTVHLDVGTPNRWDSQYYQNIINKRGLLTSDQSLILDSRTSGAVFANNGRRFGSNFGNAMIALSSIGVKTGNLGEIRKNCQFVN